MMILRRSCDMESIHLVFGIVLLAVMVSHCPVSSKYESSSSAAPPLRGSSSSSKPKVTSSRAFLGRQCNWLYRENPKDCKSYFQCLNGKSLLRRCPKNLYWNAEGSYCDWEFRTGCNLGGGKGPGQGQKPNSILSLFEDKKGNLGGGGRIKEMCVANSYKPHPSDCSKYIQCGLFGQSTVQSCGAILHWDDQNKACNWPGVANCKVGSAGGPSVVESTDSEYPAPTTTTTSTTTTTPYTTTTTTTTSRPITPPTTVEWPVAPTTATTTTTTTQRPTTSLTAKPRPTPPAGTQYPILIPSDYKVICYFTGWAIYRPDGGNYSPSDIDPSMCTHIIYAFACMNHKTFKLEMCDSWIDGPSGKNFYGQVTAFRKQGIKVMIAVGGWNDSAYRKWSEMLKDLIKMETFIQSVCEFLGTFEFDGLDLDYEYPSCPQANCNFDSKFEKQAFVALVKGLRLRCGPQTILSAAVSCNENIIREAYDVPTLSKNLDFFNLMAYDFHGAWEPHTGINAPLYKIPEDEQYLNTFHAIQTFLGMKAPPEKICLGMPMYGQSFRLTDVRDYGIGARATGPGTAGPWTGQRGMLAYYEICSQEWTDTVHDPEKRVGPYRYNASNGEWVSHDSHTILKEKCNIIKDLGLGGGMIWALDLDDWRNLCGEGHYPLLSVLKNELLGPNNRRRKVSKVITQQQNRRISSPSRKRSKLRSRKTNRG